MNRDLVTRLRLPGIFCAAVLLGCVLVAHPFAEMGVSDDWSYVRTAQVLAATGKLVYNGWATAMIGWQLFPAAWFMKLFGPSFASARATTLIVSALTAFLMQRTMVRAGLNERNAVLGTLAVALTPIYMQLSATFMTDIGGMFAVVLCLYACIRAVQAATAGGAAVWVCGAMLSNAVLGSSRQIAWLGLLVMVPGALWLLWRQWPAAKDRRTVLIPAAVAMLVGCAAVAWSLQWFARQPYSVPQHLLPVLHSLREAIKLGRLYARALLEWPFFLLAVLVAFFPEARRHGRRFWAIFGAAAVVWILTGIAIRKSTGPDAMVEPLIGDWLSPQGIYGHAALASVGPVALGIPVRMLLTVATLFGAYCLLAFLIRLRAERLQPLSASADGVRAPLSWHQLAWLVVPFSLAYWALLLPRSLDRYLLELAFFAMICVVRLYQEFVRPALPMAVPAMVALIALFSIGSVHDLFASSRAKLALHDELRAAGVPATSVDEGFELDGMNELAISGYINDERLTNPAGAFHPADHHRGMSCTGVEELDNGEPHLVPRFGFAFDPKVCGGEAPFAPVSYGSWLVFRPVELYVVKYVPNSVKNAGTQ